MEQRRLTNMIKQQERDAREKERRGKMLIREENEAANSNELILIYPLVSYEKEFYIEEHFEVEMKALKEEIEEKRIAALDAVNGDKKKIDPNYKQLCFVPDVPQYVFDLPIVKRNNKGAVQK